MTGPTPTTEQLLLKLMTDAKTHHRRDWIIPVIAVVLAAFLSSVGSSWVTVSTMQVDMARLEERLVSMSEKLSETARASKEFYSASDAEKDAQVALTDRARMQRLFDSLWPRLREMKERIRHLEDSRPETDKRAHTPWLH